MKILILFALIVLSVISINDAFAVKTISNDSTGGNCSTIGTWNSATKTCTLSNNLAEEIVIGGNGITLDGNGYTINGNNAGTGILIDTKTVITVRNINIRNFDTGISLTRANDINISKNNIINNVGVGVYSNGASQIKIIENNIENNNYGLHIISCVSSYEVSKNQISNNQLDGISLEGSGDYLCVIRENTISNNNRDGISSGASGIKITNNIIDGNTENGILVTYRSINDIISKNLISNSNSGITLGEYSSVEFFGNTIQENNYGISGQRKHGYNNNFINNANQATGGSDSYFYKEPPIGGNYWSDFSPVCYDANFDNFCDNPYKFSGDNLPWLVQNGWLTLFNLPNNIRINALDSSGATVNYSVSATHDGNPISVTCNPSSGSLFPIGETVVLCTAETGVFAKFNVIVESADTISPVVVVPNNITIQAINNNPLPVTFSVSATDDKDGPVTPICSSKSGATFPIGKTTVSCTATDKAGNTATKSFTVTITNVTSTDTDKDGIIDSKDSCPTQAETVNGYQDTDGCPDVSPEIPIPPTDTDKDGIIDSKDSCPTQAETVNGYQDTDGCPDIVPTTSEITITTASGSGQPGCEETSQGCYLPKVASVGVGGKVIFVNTDAAAHTYTSGTPSVGPSGVFDSSLVMAGGSYVWTPTEEGQYDYHCMVHPWMTGIILVGEGTYIPPTDTDNEYSPKEREWQTSGPFQIDRSQYAIGEKIFLTINGLNENEKGQISVMRPINDVDYSVYLTIPFDGAEKSAFNYYIEPQISKTNGINSVDDLSGEWIIVFRGTDYPNLNFEITDDVVPGTNIESGYDDSQYEITITTASGSGQPGCEETSQGCYLPKVASVGVGGKVIFVNTDAAAHTYTSGTPSVGPSGVFDSSLVLGAGPEPTQSDTGGSYVWTPTEEGQVPYFCMVHPWMTGIILVGEGTYIPPTEDDFDLQIIMGNQVYDLLDTVTMNLFIDGITNPQNVALEISDPSGTSIISRSFMVDSQGVPFEFRIDENFKTGTYKVVATTNNEDNTVTDTAYFKVKSQYNSFKITSVQVTDQQGNPSTLEKGEMGFIKVNLEANKAITTLVTVNLFDSDLTSIGIGSIKTTLASGNSEIILSFMIPDDVAVGISDIYVNAFSDWPSNGGIPLTDEISVMENIE